MFRLSKNQVEDVRHIISSCPLMSARYYLSLSHDVVAAFLLNTIIKKNHPNANGKVSNKTEYVIRLDQTE